MKVLVVEAHEGQLNAFEFAFLDVGFGGSKAHFTNFLPVRIRRRALADARNLQDLRPQIVLGIRRCRHGAE